MVYKEDEYVQLSGLQHFLFCRRQWALIHVESQWAENYLTVDGEIMHEKVHNPECRERRKNIIIVRALKIHSSTLGVSGECDVVEFHQSPEGIRLKNSEGTWLPFPIEYKRGKEKMDDSDKAQLCAQALCLEEMFCCDIKEGALFYGEYRHRIVIEFTDELRNTVKESIKAMHQYMERGYTPKAKKTSACKACSLKDCCLPQLQKAADVLRYLKMDLEDDA